MKRICYTEQSLMTEEWCVERLLLFCNQNKTLKKTRFYFRYMAIIHPLRPRVTGRVIVAIIIIWMASTMLSFPNLLYSKALDFNYTVICTMVWPDGPSTVSKIDFW